MRRLVWTIVVSAGLSAHALAQQADPNSPALVLLNGKVVTLDTGVAWTVTQDLQLDAALSRGISASAPDWSWTVGLSTRF